ncbi:uncharacterized protein K02A2.6-like [Acipenser ruthenus]|uniref:uncharacterized protein K02A2.6-like n=1 Tax=Acipenser ruthenus TaxID=7906 RepID=UPI0027428DA8|nr:uncharacterized protein K02A2.6-like [Acipenser ruthenus]
MATFGSIGEFDESTDWTEYVERLGHYFAANDITDGGKQRSIFLSVCGSKTYSLIRNLVSPLKPTDKSFAELCLIVKQHKNPKPSEIVQTFKFHNRFRQPGESVATYVAELRRLSEHCVFGEMLDRMLRDRLVCGLQDDRIQRRLLSETALDFKKAVEIAQAMEAAAQQAHDLKPTASTPPVIHKAIAVGSPAIDCRQGEGKNMCYRCGQPHAARDCRFKDAVCHNCNKKGHIAKVCRSKNQPRQHRGGWQPKMPKATHSLEGEVDEDEPEVVYSMHQAKTEKVEPIYVTVKAQGEELQMEVDTGASFTVISESTYRGTWHGKQLPPLSKSAIKLRTYTGEEIKVIGIIAVEVQYNQQSCTLPILIVFGNGPSLLGRNWLKKLKLDWSNLYHMGTTSVQDILNRYAVVFRDELGTLRGTKAVIEVDGNVKPRFFKARTVPYALKEKVSAELQRLQKAGIIEPVQFSKWAAPIVPIMKPDGSIRICGDYKLTVNQASRLDAYPIPRVEDLFSNITGGQAFTKLDLSHAYQQLLLEDSSKEVLTINTHKGLFRYTRLPFGVSSAPGIFQRTLESLLAGLPHVLVYLDDILITGPDPSKHMQVLEEVLKRLADAGLRLKKQKCIFLAPEVQYLGHKIDAEGIHPAEEKVRAIAEAPTPKNTTELKSFLGMVNYYHRFLPNLSTLLAPLHHLLQKKVPWCWKPQQEKAFQSAKKLLLTSQLLVHFDSKKPLLLACDASPYGVGAVLSHTLPDGSERPISFASRTLAPAEKNYSQLDKEALAIVFGVKKFHQYLYGHHFTICSDHKPLMSLFSESKLIPPMASGRIQRWALLLAGYEYEICYKSGETHSNADGLSRLPLKDTPSHVQTPGDVVLLLENLSTFPVNLGQIQSGTRRDPILSRVLTYVRSGWPAEAEMEDLRPYFRRKEELSIQDNCLLWGNRVIVPPQSQEKVIAELHEAHPGISRMKSLARSMVWWPCMDQALEKKVRECTICQSTRHAPPPAPLHPWEWPDRPWARLHVDYAGPFMGKMFLILIDAHSKWIDVHVMSSATSQATISQLRVTFATHGLPEMLVTDNGTAFTSEEFQQFCKKNSIKHVRTSPYHPASNGLAERAVQTVKEGLKKMRTGTIETKLARFLFHYRITPQTTTGSSPAELLMGRRPRSCFDVLRPAVGGRVRAAQAKQKFQHDQHAKVRLLNVGDTVYVRMFGVEDKWTQGTILEKVGPVSFQVELTDGRVIRRHQDHLRKYQAATVPQSERPEDVQVPLGDDYSPNPVQLEFSTEGVPVDPEPAVDPGPEPTLAPAPELRRSQRVRRAPQKLDC